MVGCWKMIRAVTVEEDGEINVEGMVVKRIGDDCWTYKYWK